MHPSLSHEVFATPAVKGVEIGGGRGLSFDLLPQAPRPRIDRRDQTLRFCSEHGLPRVFGLTLRCRFVLLDAVRVCRRPNGRLLGAAALALIVRRRLPRAFGTGIVLDGLRGRRFARPRRRGGPVACRCGGTQSSYHGGSCRRVMATSRPDRHWPSSRGPALERRSSSVGS